MNIDANQYYDFLEVQDFNKLFVNPNFIEESFGETIKVTVNTDPRKVFKRSIVENPEKAVIFGNNKEISKPTSKVSNNQKEDPELLFL